MGPCILIIDDDVTIRKTLALLIRKNELGRVVGELASGEEAVEEILFVQPEIVLVDLLLPVLDGIGIVQQARSRGYMGKFIMISQVEETEMVSRAYESGVLFYIGKPLNAIEVVNVIRNVANQVNLENSIAQIKTAVQWLGGQPATAQAAPARQNAELDERITAIFTDIGIVGAVGSDELREILRKLVTRKAREPSGTVPLAGLYAEVLEESGKSGPTARKALEQRIRRTVQKALTTLAELGSNDYADSTFMDYSTLLFDFKQVRQEMRHIEDPREEPGKISTKKFIAGLAARLS